MFSIFTPDSQLNLDSNLKLPSGPRLKQSNVCVIVFDCQLTPSWLEILF